jgi:hypothetical protein
MLEEVKKSKIDAKKPHCVNLLTAKSIPLPGKSTKRKTFCKDPKCRKPTIHKVTHYKTGKARPTAQMSTDLLDSNACALMT